MCELGDAEIAKRLEKAYKKKKSISKGIAFPTCINVNNVVSNYSAMPEDTTVLKDGDQVRM